MYQPLLIPLTLDVWDSCFMSKDRLKNAEIIMFGNFVHNFEVLSLPLQFLWHFVFSLSFHFGFNSFQLWQKCAPTQKALPKKKKRKKSLFLSASWGRKLSLSLQVKKYKYMSSFIHVSRKGRICNYSFDWWLNFSTLTFYKILKCLYLSNTKWLCEKDPLN